MRDLRHIEHQISALNYLIRINNDRITGYKKRIEAVLDDDLCDIFLSFVYQGQQNISDLTECVYFLNGEPDESIRISGKFYNAWINFKPTSIEQPMQTMLDYCENTEDVAKSAYRKTLDDKESIWRDKKIINHLASQFNDLKRSHTLVKTLRDKQ